MFLELLSEGAHAHVELPIPVEAYAAVTAAVFASLFVITLAFANVGKSPE